MAHHIGFGKANDTNTFDAFQNRQRFVQPFGAPAGQVALGGVASDHHLRILAQPGQRHLHLGAGGVLGFVQDHDGARQGAAAHEGQRRHLDHALLAQPRRLFAQHVEQRVGQGAQIGIDLLVEVAGQKAQPLARLNGRPRQDDTLDAAFLQHMGGEGGSEIGLAGAGGADAEDQRVGAHQREIGSLHRRTRPGDAARRGADGAAACLVGHAAASRLGEADLGIHFRQGNAFARSEPGIERLENRRRPFAVGAFRRHQIATAGQAHAQHLFQPGEILFMRPAQRRQ